MNRSHNSPVFMFSDADPHMQRAYEQARATFGYFWRELAWEQRRIIPGLDLACVKAPFSDPGTEATATGQPEAEQMWVSDVVFDGKLISGTLINAPRWVQSVAEGDRVSMPIGGITDWMYAIFGRVYGAYTVNLMRARMDPAERAQHDEAWGLDFGDPQVIEVAPANEDGSPPDLNADHPMSINMGESLVDFLNADPGNVHAQDDGGWTMLHHQALAGSTTSVSLLLKHGADVNAVTNHGMTPLALASSLDWNNVAQLLVAAGGR